MRNALDFSWSYPEPAELAAMQLDALCYTGNARPSPSYCADLRARGVVLTFVQETTSDRSQAGYQAGVYDAQFADRRAGECGHPLDRTVVYVVSDGSRGDPAWNAPAIADYGEGIARTSARPFVFYGNRYAVDAALLGSARVPEAAARDLGRATAGGWLPATWGFDVDRDLLRQEPNIPAPIDGTDFNTTFRNYTGLGKDDFMAALSDAEQRELYEGVVALAKHGVPAFGLPNVFASLDAMTRTGVPEYGLPNLFAGQHRITELLLAGGAIGGDADALTDDDRASLGAIRDRIDALLGAA